MEEHSGRPQAGRQVPQHAHRPGLRTERRDSRLHTRCGHRNPQSAEEMPWPSATTSTSWSLHRLSHPWPHVTNDYVSRRLSSESLGHPPSQPIPSHGQPCPLCPVPQNPRAWQRLVTGLRLGVAFQDRLSGTHACLCSVDPRRTQESGRRRAGPPRCVLLCTQEPRSPS